AVVEPRRVSRGHAASRTERGLQGGELLRCRVRAWMLVPLDLADGNEFVGEAARSVGGRPPLLRPERERVLLLARNAPALGDVLAGLAHRLQRKHLLHPGIRETPAERRVPEGLVPAWKRRVGLTHGERRARHR